MPKLKTVRESLLLAYDDNMITDDEFVLLYELNSSKNPEIPYWLYDRFNLELLCDDECRTEFRFLKNDIYRLNDALQIPDNICCYNGTVCTSIEALCILLKRFAYPCRYLDMVPRFGRSIPELCIILQHMKNFIFIRWGHLLNSFNQVWLTRDCLEVFANKVHDKGAPLENCWGFIDGTVRPVSRPGENQRIVYNGHKRVHALKFQSVVTPNGHIANMFGPIEGKRHDSGMLADSGLLNLLQQHSYDSNGNPLCIYGDPAYPLRVHLQSCFKGANLNAQQKDWNKSMSEVRVAVEWSFGEIVNYFKFLDFKKNLKIGLSSVGKTYLICALLSNARNCLYRNQVSKYFDLEPPVLEEYFQ